MRQLQQHSDEDLMVLVQAHDHAAFSELVMRHSDRFYALSYRTLFNQIDAEDIVQDSFLKLWQNPALWKGKRGVKFTTWFYRIIINACYDRNKKKSSQEISLNDHGAQLPAKDNTWQSLSDIEAALQALPERQRTALNLCFYEGLTNQEAADVMQIKLKALQSLIMRAKTTLKAQFKITEEHHYEA